MRRIKTSSIKPSGGGDQKIVVHPSIARTSDVNLAYMARLVSKIPGTGKFRHPIADASVKEIG
jgi:hypothetical protein